MVIYNVTVNIEEDIHKDWLEWMKTVHIPDVMSTKLFTHNKLCRVLTSEDEGATYSIQYTARDMESVRIYQELYAYNLQKEHEIRYRNKVVAFRTMLEVVHEEEGQRE